MKAGSISTKMDAKNKVSIRELMVALLHKYIFFLRTPQEKAYREYIKAGGERIRHDYVVGEGDVIFDVGGYKGDWSEDFVDSGATIYIFEPSSEYYEILKNRFEANDNVRIFPYGLDKYTHSATVSMEKDAGSQYHDSGSVESAEYVDILAFMAENKVDRVKLMKLNIEGGEYDILEHLIETNEIIRFENIQIQFHDIPEINGEKRMKKIQEELDKTHVLEWAFRPFIHESWKIRE